MVRRAYLILSLVAFALVAGAHALAYFRPVPHALIAALWLFALGTSAPVVVLFVRIVRDDYPGNVWRRFWHAMLAHCPPWIWASFAAAWLLVAIPLVRAAQGRSGPPTFSTAVVLMLISAGLSYAVTLTREH